MGLISAMKGRLDKHEVDQVLAALGHDASQRAEQLTVDQIQKLVETLRLAELEKGQTQ